MGIRSAVGEIRTNGYSYEILSEAPSKIRKIEPHRFNKGLREILSYCKNHIHPKREGTVASSVQIVRNNCCYAIRMKKKKKNTAIIQAHVQAGYNENITICSASIGSSNFVSRVIWNARREINTREHLVLEVEVSRIATASRVERK